MIHRDSVMMFLPNSQIRHRDSTIKRTFVRIIEMIFGFGYYPYRSMTKEEVQSFLARNIREKPFAEDYLYTVKKTRKPWKYARSDYPFINTYIFIKKYLQK